MDDIIMDYNIMDYNLLDRISTEFLRHQQNIIEDYRNYDENNNIEDSLSRMDRIKFAKLNAEIARRIPQGPEYVEVVTSPNDDPLTVKSLDEIADYFSTLASDQIACMRWQSTKRAKHECEIKAEVWEDAAMLLRNIKIVP